MFSKSFEIKCYLVTFTAVLQNFQNELINYFLFPNLRKNLKVERKECKLIFYIKVKF